jgi:hypothetical protein
MPETCVGIGVALGMRPGFFMGVLGLAEQIGNAITEGPHSAPAHEFAGLARSALPGRRALSADGQGIGASQIREAPDLAYG